MHDSLLYHFFIRSVLGKLAQCTLVLIIATMLYSPAQAAPPPTLFVVGMASSAISADPHFTDLQPDFNVAWHIFEPLLALNAYTSETDYLLASKLTQLDTFTWEIELKQDIMMHDGQLLRSDDVVYSIERLLHHPDEAQSRGSMTNYGKGISKIKTDGAFKLKISTDIPNFNLVGGLSRIFIVRKPADGHVSHFSDFNSGRDAIGSGPFKLISFSANSEVRLQRFEGYKGPAPSYIEQALLKPIPNQTERLRQFVNGDVDLIEKATPSDIESIQGKIPFNATSATTHRLLYLTLHTGKPRYVFDKHSGVLLEKNPLANLQVRKAISLALDRNYLTHEVLKISTNAAADQFVLPSSQDYAPNLKQHTYDPDAAKALLKQTDYPDGFRLTIHGPNDRYLLDGKILTQIASMLTKIGIETTPISLPKAEFFRDTQLYQASFAGYSSSGQILDMLNALVRTPDPAKKFGHVNYSEFTNPQIDRLLEQADAELQPALQRTYLYEATELALDDYVVLPLYFEPSIWLIKGGLEYWQNANERTLVQSVRPL